MPPFLISISSDIWPIFFIKKCNQFKVILQAIFSRAKVTGCVTTDQTRPTVLKLIKKLKSNGYIRKFSPAALGLEATPLENPGYAPAFVERNLLTSYCDVC